MRSSHVTELIATTLPQTIFVKTFGCQMNVYDSERLARLMAVHGYQATDNPSSADLIVLNTCHIREKAAEKVYSELGRLRRSRSAANGNPSMKIVVAGCVAQAEGAAMLERMPEIDVVVGPQAYHRLPELLARQDRDRGGIVDTEFDTIGKFDALPLDDAPSPVSAFVTVQEGCDKFCTFCVVPYTRGMEVSRPATDVIKECRQRVRAGAKEITLLGQNVNAYRGSGVNEKIWGLGRLLKELAEIDGVERLRYTTSHPRDMDDELIGAHHDVPSLMPFLHLPVQSGSDAVLAAMNRRHTVADYLRTVEQLRQARADIALSSDFIVGFPGESDEDFDATLALVRRVGFAQSFSFKYSTRPGTPGSVMPRQVGDAIKSKRLAELQKLLSKQADEFQQSMLGEYVDILLSKHGRHHGQLVGNSPYMNAVHVTTDRHAVGDLINVRIDAVGSHSLSGVLAEPIAQVPINNIALAKEGSLP